MHPVTPVTLTGNDTNTIDLTATGTTIEANVRVDPAPGNVTLTSSANGLRAQTATAIPAPSAVAPLPGATLPVVGTSTDYARADHVHQTTVTNTTTGNEITLTIDGVSTVIRPVSATVSEFIGFNASGDLVKGTPATSIPVQDSNTVDLTFSLGTLAADLKIDTVSPGNVVLTSNTNGLRATMTMNADVTITNIAPAATPGHFTVTLSDASTLNMDLTSLVSPTPSSLAPVSSAALPVVGTSVEYARADHVHPITNTLTTTGGKITSTVSGVAAEIDPVAGTPVELLGFDAAGDLVKGAGAAGATATTNVLAAAGSAITSTVNGVAATITPAAGTIAQAIGFDAAGALVRGAAAAATTTNTLAAATGAITSTVNGVAATITPAAGTLVDAIGFNAAGDLVRGNATAGRVRPPVADIAARNALTGNVMEDLVLVTSLAQWHVWDGTAWQVLSSEPATVLPDVADAAARTALTGMATLDHVRQTDTGVWYIYNGTAWQALTAPQNVAQYGHFTFENKPLDIAAGTAADYVRTVGFGSAIALNGTGSGITLQPGYTYEIHAMIRTRRANNAWGRYQLTLDGTAVPNTDFYSGHDTTNWEGDGASVHVLRIPTAGTAQVLRLRRLSFTGANGNADGTVTIKAIAIEAEIVPTPFQVLPTWTVTATVNSVAAQVNGAASVNTFEGQYTQVQVALAAGRSIATVTPVNADATIINPIAGIVMVRANGTGNVVLGVIDMPAATFNGLQKVGSWASPNANGTDVEDTTIATGIDFTRADWLVVTYNDNDASAMRWPALWIDVKASRVGTNEYYDARDSGFGRYRIENLSTGVIWFEDDTGAIRIRSIDAYADAANGYVIPTATVAAATRQITATVNGGAVLVDGATSRNTWEGVGPVVVSVPVNVNRFLSSVTATPGATAAIVDGRSGLVAVSIPPGFGGNVALAITDAADDLPVFYGTANAGVDVTFRDLRFRMPSGGNRSMQISTTSGTKTLRGFCISSTDSAGSSPITVNATTTPQYVVSSWNYGGAGQRQFFHFIDDSNGNAYEAMMAVGPAFNSNIFWIKEVR